MSEPLWCRGCYLALALTVLLSPVSASDSSVGPLAPAMSAAGPIAPGAGPALMASYAGRVVGAVTLRGAEGIDERLDEYLLQRPADRLDPELLRQTMRLLHLLGRFRSISVALHPGHGDTVDVTFDVIALPLVRALRFSGDGALLKWRGPWGVRRRDLERAAVDIAAGLPFRQAAADDATHRVAEVYRRHGYWEASVKAMVTEVAAGGDVAIEIRIDRGEPMRVSRVDLSGADALGFADKLKKRLHHKPGRRLVMDELEKDRERLLRDLARRGFPFATAELTVGKPADDGRSVPVAIRIEPKQRLNVELTVPLHAWNLHWLLFKLVGNYRLGRAMISDVLPIWERRSMDPTTLREATESLQRLWQSHGYPDADVRVTAQNGEDIQDDARTPADRISSASVSVAVSEGHRMRVGRISFAGNRQILSAELLGAMNLRPRGWRSPLFRKEVLESDVAELARRYRARGFRNVSVRVAQVSYRRERIADIDIQIDEGLRSVVTAVHVIDPRQTRNTDELAGELPFGVGDPYVQALVDAGADLVRERYHQRGFASVSVDPEVELVDFGRQATVRYHVEPGMQYLLDHIVIAGAPGTKRRVIRRGISLQSGAPLSVEGIFAIRQELQRARLFDVVTVVPSTVGEVKRQHTTLRNLVVRLKDRKAGLFEFGFGWATEDGARTFGTIGHTNIMGSARRITLSADISERRQKLLARYSEPWIWATRMELSIRTYIDREKLTGFSFERSGASGVLLQKEMVRFLQGSAEYRRESVRIFDLGPGSSITRDFHGRVDVAEVVGSITLDSRDDPFAPRRGTLSSLSLHWSTPALGAEVSYLKVTTGGRWYFRLQDQAVVAAAFRAGLSDRELPLSERFFIGGATTMRGFSRFSAGPFTRQLLIHAGETASRESRSFVGGNAMLLCNVELRFPLLWGFNGTTFVDVGNAWRNLEDARLDDLRYTAGAGLNFTTPVGPVRYEVGWNLDPRDGEEGVESHLSVGFAF